MSNKGRPQGIERRAYAIQELRIDSGEDDQPHIRGYAAVFDTLSEPIMELGSYRFLEKVQKGAFTKTLREADIRALWNHDVNYVLGRNRAGTLRLIEDERGLAVDIVPPDTQWARDALETLRRGDVTQMSFGFRVVKDRWEVYTDEETGKRTEIRTLLEVRLFDVSPVTFPAYPTTDVGVRAALDMLRGYLPEPPDEAKPAQDGHLDGHSGDVDAQTEPEQELHSAPERERELALRERLL